MNITFLIGNGFDRNLGLETAYSQFVAHYKTTPASSDNLKRFRDYIKENEELWSNAEIALGEFSEQFNPGEGMLFSECHIDFCEHLADYLKKQEKRIDFSSAEEDIKKAFSRINTIIEPFPTEERAQINNTFSKHSDEARIFNFITYNYTGTLEKCIDVIRNNKEILGNHRVGNSTYGHSIGEICHIHGTVEGNMVFGVNDESQIKKNDIFDCDDGDIYKDSIIKRQTNALYQENIDAKANKILSESHVIYIYGMSIGGTDKLWWERCCSWLNASGDRHLIIYKHDMPIKGVVPINYQVFERQCKHNFTSYYNADQKTKNNIEKRIHITNDNIFLAISGLAINHPINPPQSHSITNQNDAINGSGILDVIDKSSNLLSSIPAEVIESVSQASEILLNN